MNPAARLSVALLLGLVLWLPTLTASMHGDIDLPAAALRYLVAFLFARMAVAGVARLLESYSVVADVEHEGSPMGSDDDRGRRADDMTAAGLS